MTTSHDAQPSEADPTPTDATTTTTTTDDPLTVSLWLLKAATSNMFEQKSGGTRADKIALGHAWATYALACEMRMQNMMLARGGQQEPEEAPAGAERRTDSGLVVPR